MRSTSWSQLRHRLVDLVETAVFEGRANVTVWLMVHVMFIEHEHEFLEHEHRFIKSHVVLSPVRTLKNSCSDLNHVICTAEFSLMHSHILLSSLCLVLYVSNTKYLMVFQSISVLFYLDTCLLCWHISSYHVLVYALMSFITSCQDTYCSCKHTY